MKKHNHIDSFERSFEQANHWLNDLADRLGLANKEEAYNIFRAVLHVLRDRLPPDSAVALAAQLPLLLKGVFFDGWSLAGKPVKMGEEEFLDAVQRQVAEPVDAPRVAVGVVRLLAEKLSPGMMEKIAFLLPKRLRDDIVLPALDI